MPGETCRCACRAYTCWHLRSTWCLRLCDLAPLPGWWSSCTNAATGSTPASSRRRICWMCCATHGYPEVARTLLWQSEMPSWLYEVDNGATTFWETWDAISPDGEIRPMSFNHYAPGSVDDWLYRRVAGIRSTSPGYRTAVIEPDFEIGVDHVAAHVGTPYGGWRVEWTRTGDAASVVVDVPFGCRGRLVTLSGLRSRSRRAASEHAVARRAGVIRGSRVSARGASLRGQSCNVRHDGTVEPASDTAFRPSVPPQEQPFEACPQAPLDLLIRALNVGGPRSEWRYEQHRGGTREGRRRPGGCRRGGLRRRWSAAPRR